MFNCYYSHQFGFTAAAVTILIPQRLQSFLQSVYAHRAHKHRQTHSHSQDSVSVASTATMAAASPLWYCYFSSEYRGYDNHYISKTSFLRILISLRACNSLAAVILLTKAQWRWVTVSFPTEKHRCACVLAAPALWHDRCGDVSAGSDVVRGMAGWLTGHSGAERAGGGADETTQARQRGEVGLVILHISSCTNNISNVTNSDGGKEQFSAIKPNALVDCDYRMRSSGSRLWVVASSGLAHGGSTAACRSPGQLVNHELSQILSVCGACQNCNSDCPLWTFKSGSFKSEETIKVYLNRFLTVCGDGVTW